MRSLLGTLSRLPRSLLPRSLLPLSRLPLSRLPLSRLPLSLSSVMLATRRTGSVEARLSPPLPPRSCDSLLKLLLVIWFWPLLSPRPSRPSLRSNRSNRSLSRSLLSLSPPRSRLELDLKGDKKGPHLSKCCAAKSDVKQGTRANPSQFWIYVIGKDSFPKLCYIWN